MDQVPNFIATTDPYASLHQVMSMCYITLFDTYNILLYHIIFIATRDPYASLHQVICMCIYMCVYVRIYIRIYADTYLYT